MHDKFKLYESSALTFIWKFLTKIVNVIIMKAFIFSFIMMVLFNISNAQKFITDHIKTSSDSIYLEEVDMNKFNFMSGSWQGEAMGGYIEEVWSKNRAGNLMGMFRFIENDKLIFSEFCSIQKLNNSIVYIVKHFDSKMVGWENKDSYVKFPLIQLKKNVAYFDGATIKLNKKGILSFYVLAKTKTGEHKEMVFNYNRLQRK